MNNKSNSKKAFTLMEILIASAIFSLFMLGVFSLYNMGSRMYISGTWKYNKQKEAERFLQVLKERIEQTSVPSKIKADNTEFTIEKLDNVGFFIDSSNKEIILSDKKYLLEFLISKPDITQASYPAQIIDTEKSTKKGLVIFNALYSESQGDNLFKLTLYSNNTTKGDGNFFATNLGSCNFPPAGFDTFITANKADFNAAPSDYGFKQLPDKYCLTDVKSVELKYGITATDTIDTGNLESFTSETIKKNPIVSIKIKMQDPRNSRRGDNTVFLEEKLLARIDSSVKLCPVGFGKND